MDPGMVPRELYEATVEMWQWFCGILVVANVAQWGVGRASAKRAEKRLDDLMAAQREARNV